MFSGLLGIALFVVDLNIHAIPHIQVAEIGIMVFEILPTLFLVEII